MQGRGRAACAALASLPDGRDLHASILDGHD
jgi:hypothetical protein